MWSRRREAVLSSTFGARRMHGTDAALNSARAFWIAGVNATSNVLAGQRFGIPVAGTLAHSYIQAHGDEAAAFLAFANLYPDTVLSDGYLRHPHRAYREGDRTGENN